MYIIRKRNRKKEILVLLVLIFGIIITTIVGVNQNIHYFEVISVEKLPEDNYIMVFYQPSCMHCLKELPKIKILAKEFPVKAINVIEDPELVQKYEITETPTLILFFNNKSTKIKGNVELKNIYSLIELMKNSSTTILENNSKINEFINPNKKSTCNIIQEEKSCS
ncbi:MAG: thioredoxin family protein [Candidatus Woesearchaeota archaeon]